MLRRHWEILLYMPVRQLPFHVELEPVPENPDIFAQFTFTFITNPEGVRGAIKWKDCFEQLQRMRLWTASVETHAAQWHFCTRMAKAYMETAEVRSYLESAEW